MGNIESQKQQPQLWGWAGPGLSLVSLGASFKSDRMEEEIRGMYFLKEHQFQEGQKQAAFYSCAILLSNTELGDKERVEPGQGGYNQ